MTGEIFGIARLLAHQNDARSLRSLAEHGLRSVPVQVAGSAVSRRIAQRGHGRL
jgi:hypothetical protein